MSFFKRIWNHQVVQRTLYFFPFRLVVLHFKKNLGLVFFWLMLASFFTGYAGKGYGVPYLFLDPEYMGRVDFWSFLILGFSFGGFLMAFHISSYIQNAYRFPFLATVNKPFFKYSLNNSIIPGIFLIAYIYHIIKFQSRSELFLVGDELELGSTLAQDVGGFLLGILLFMVPGHMYFLALSRNIFKILGISEEKLLEKKNRKKPIQVLMQKNLQWRNVEAPGRTITNGKLLRTSSTGSKLG